VLKDGITSHDIFWSCTLECLGLFQEHELNIYSETYLLPELPQRILSQSRCTSLSGLKAHHSISERKLNYFIGKTSFVSWSRRPCLSSLRGTKKTEATKGCPVEDGAILRGTKKTEATKRCPVENGTILRGTKMTAATKRCPVEDGAILRGTQKTEATKNVPWRMEPF
jgi:hypothetical protein